MNLDTIYMRSIGLAALLLAGNATRLPAHGADRGSDRDAAVKLIVETLATDGTPEKSAEQVACYQAASNQLRELCPTNVVVGQIVNNAVSKAAAAADDREAAKLLREGLRQAKTTLEFQPFTEAPLPDGFPEPTPVGEIQVKRYPEHRLARTQMADPKAEATAFWTLFLHIQARDIAMTAPVEMTYAEGGEGAPRRQSMSFLYRSTEQGKTEKGETVEVIDVPPLLTVSIGLRGNATGARLTEAQSHLQDWLTDHADEYEAAGPLRVMGYNSPFVPVDRRFTEVEIPVRFRVPAP